MIIIYCAEKYSLQKNNENLLVSTEKTGHEINADKSERMSVPCVENIEERHNIKVSNATFYEGITQKNHTFFTNKLRAD